MRERERDLLLLLMMLLGHLLSNFSVLVYIALAKSIFRISLQFGFKEVPIC